MKSNLLRYVFNVKKPGNFNPESHGLKIKTLHDFTITTKKEFEKDFNYGLHWHTQEQPYHPDYTDVWFDKETVLVGGIHDTLRFRLFKQPRTFNSGLTIPWCAGIVTSKMAYKYGYFEAVMKMPEGKYAWPAFWMFSKDSWPGEIDITETFSRKTGRYNKWCFKNFELQTNVHLGTNPENHVDYGGKSHPLPMDVRNNFIAYGVLWTPHEITFVYNGYPVRTIRDKKVLNSLNANPPMNLILGTGCEKGKDPDPHVMEVKKVTVWR